MDVLESGRLDFIARQYVMFRVGSLIFPSCFLDLLQIVLLLRGCPFLFDWKMDFLLLVYVFWGQCILEYALHGNSLLEIGSSPFWSSNVWGPDCISPCCRWILLFLWRGQCNIKVPHQRVRKKGKLRCLTIWTPLTVYTDAGPSWCFSSSSWSATSVSLSSISAIELVP